MTMGTFSRWHSFVFLTLIRERKKARKLPNKTQRQTEK